MKYPNKSPPMIDIKINNDGSINPENINKNNPNKKNKVKLVILKNADNPTITKMAIPTKISDVPANTFISQVSISKG